MSAAFPSYQSGTSGLTKREWFAAHAPDVPDWFRYKAEGMPPKPTEKEPDPQLVLTKDQQLELALWIAGDSDDFGALSKGVQAFMVRAERLRQEHQTFHEWHMRSREEKFFAWRTYYADKMMEITKP